MLARGLRRLGCRVVPGEANYLLFHCPAELCGPLRERGILVRWWSDPPIENWLRVTIGTDEEMEELTRGLREIVS